jgi:hypothetical protein
LNSLREGNILNLRLQNPSLPPHQPVSRNQDCFAEKSEEKQERKEAETKHLGSGLDYMLTLMIIRPGFF